MTKNKAKGILSCSPRQKSLGHLLWCSCICICVLALPLTVHADSPNFETVAIAKDVYALIAKPGILGEWGSSNTVFIVNQNNVVVVDTQMFPSRAVEIISEIRKVTDKPVRYVINTHWHRDHTQGNQVFVDAFGPDVKIIQHELEREDQIKNQPAELTVRAPEDIARLEKLIATNKDEKGVELDAANRMRIANLLATQKAYFSEVPNIRVTSGTLVFNNKLVLHEGNREIDVDYFGYAHTRGDIVVYLPMEKIVVTGDMVQPGIPDTKRSYPLKWIGTLESLKALDWSINVPGHGKVQNDKEMVNRNIAYLNELISGVRTAVAKKMTAEQAVESIDLKKYVVIADHTFMGAAASVQNERNATAVRRVYDEITGKVVE
jgi:cyclase